MLSLQIYFTGAFATFAPSFFVTISIVSSCKLFFVSGFGRSRSLSGSRSRSRCGRIYDNAAATGTTTIGSRNNDGINARAAAFNAAAENRAARSAANRRANRLANGRANNRSNLTANWRWAAARTVAPSSFRNGRKTCNDCNDGCHQGNNSGFWAKTHGESFPLLKKTGV